MGTLVKFAILVWLGLLGANIVCTALRWGFDNEFWIEWQTWTGKLFVGWVFFVLVPTLVVGLIVGLFR